MAVAKEEYEESIRNKPFWKSVKGVRVVPLIVLEWEVTQNGKEVGKIKPNNLLTNRITCSQTE